MKTDDQHTPAGLRHETVAMPRFVPPFVGRVARLAFRIRIVDEDDLIEGNERVLERNFAFNFPDRELELLG